MLVWTLLTVLCPPKACPALENRAEIPSILEQLVPRPRSSRPLIGPNDSPQPDTPLPLYPRLLLLYCTVKQGQFQYDLTSDPTARHRRQ